MSISDLTNRVINSILEWFPVRQDDGTLFVATPQNVLAALSVATFPQSLNVTFTGTLVTPIVLPVAPGVGIVEVSNSGDNAVNPAAGVAVNSQVYFSDQTGLLTAISFNNLAALIGPSATWGPLILPNCTSISLPALVSVGGDFAGVNMPVLTSYSAPKLTFIGGMLDPSVATLLTTLSFPSLKSVGSAFQPNQLPALTSFNFPALEYVGTALAPSALPLLTSMTFPSLRVIASPFSTSVVSGCPSMTTFSLAALTAMYASLDLHQTNGALANVTIGAPGVTKELGGASINVSGQALTAVSVNSILATLVSLDGTNGTTLWGAGKTVNLSGGTSAAPSGQGVTDKATLTARGATVTTN